MDLSRLVVLVRHVGAEASRRRGPLRGQLATQLAGRFESHPDFFLADEDRVVVQTRGRATTRRGQPYDNTYCLIFRVRDGRLTEVIEHCDTALVDRLLEPPARPAVETGCRL